MRDAIVENPHSPHFDELSTLFNMFRISHLNRRYYAARLKSLKTWDTVLSAIVIAATASSFGVLAIDGVPHKTAIAAILAVIGFVASVVVPIFKLSIKIDDASNKACAFHFAAQLLESALRFVRNSEGQDGEVAGWVRSGEEAYKLAGALPDTDAEDRKLIKKVEGEIDASFPPNYIWHAL